MKQSGHKIAKEPDKSEQTATGQTSGDDEKAVDDELPVVPLDTNEAKDGTEDGSLTEGASQENPAASGDDTKQSVSEKKNPADQSSTKKDKKTPAADNDNKSSQTSSDQKDDAGTNTESRNPDSKDTDSKDSSSKDTESKDSDGKDTGKKDSDTIELPFVPAE